MEEPVTPGGRFFLQPEMDTIIHCIIGSKFDVDVDAIKAQLEATFLRHPRFSSVAAATKLNYNTIVNTSFTLSNVIGPLEEIMFAGNPITYICATSSSLPHAMTIHMVSYMGVARLQILVARDIIPDPEILARCFEDSLQDMKEVILRDLSNGFE